MAGILLGPDVTLRFQYRRYRLPFATAVRTAHGRWTEREGALVRIEQPETGAIGYGEAAPLPWFGTETVDEIQQACAGIGEWVERERLAEAAHPWPCLRHAVTAAGQAEAARSDGGAVGVAALLPAGREALGRIGRKTELGFRVFKWKIGVADLGDELALLDDVCAALPGGAKLRLDANGALDRRKAERWLERCAERPVEFFEQPCEAEDTLRGLAEDWPTPLALDESLAGEGDVDRWLGAGWPDVFVVKPALLGDVAGTLAKLGRARADVVFSSALETAVGAQAGLRAALDWAGRVRKNGGTPRALGFGVWPLFQDRRFDGPVALPFVRAEDVERIDPGAIWEALA